MPAESTVRGWALDDTGGFSAKYARARDLQADCLAEEIVAISDEAPEVVTRGEDDAKEVALDSGFVARQRLRVDARKWFASKVAPKKYGDRQQVEHTGANGGPMQTVTAQMSPEQAAQAYKELMGG